MSTLENAIWSRNGRREGREIRFLCPSHDDHHPSARWNPEREVWYCDVCKAGGGAQSLADALGITIDRQTDAPSLTVDQLATAKRLPMTLMQRWHVEDIRQRGTSYVRIPYTDEQGQVAAIRYRYALSGDHRFGWRRGDKPIMYGLSRLANIRKCGWVLLVEGESDVWTCDYYNIPALGIPGKATWRDEWSEILNGLDVALWCEPDADDLVERVGASIPSARIIYAPNGTKDVSEAHLATQDVATLVRDLREAAIRYSDLLDMRARERELTARRIAYPLIYGPFDQMSLIEQAIRESGYAGEIKPAMIIYLALTSRVLAQRDGTMPVHTVLVGAPGSGKSYTLSCVLRQFPPEAYHIIDASSPRVLIYDTAPLRHRALIYAEADSIPRSEDNPAASAMRTLLQDHHVAYDVVVRDPDTGAFQVQRIEREGPTVLITTATRRLSAQMDSRVYTVELSEDREQLRTVLETQALLEIAGSPPPEPAIIEYQTYLQQRAPIRVLVPYAQDLVKLIDTAHAEPRITRDFARLVSLIKCVALLRRSREIVDGADYVIAQVDDYAYVYELIADVYACTVVPARVRAVVDAVQQITSETPTASVARIAQLLAMSQRSVQRAAHVAIEAGWLTTDVPVRRGVPLRLALGDPLPTGSALPSPETLAAVYRS